MTSRTTKGFYDDLAELYHLIYADWPRSMERQGGVLAEVIGSEWPDSNVIADVACGIGTQAIALASRGFRVEASDLSESALERAEREAAARDLSLNLRVDDMSRLSTHGDGSADIVLACDNAVPHLLSNEEIVAAFRQFYRVARRGCIISVRDYARTARSGRHLEPFGARSFASGIVSLYQVWDFAEDLYDLNFYFVFDDGVHVETRVFRARYYAVTIDTLIGLMEDAGFVNVRRIDDLFFQPLIVGSKIRS